MMGYIVLVGNNIYRESTKYVSGIYTWRERREPERGRARKGETE